MATLLTVIPSEAPVVSDSEGKQSPSARVGRRLFHPGTLSGLALLAAIALLLGLAVHPLAVDDAFVTYRYAQNLATGQGFTYNAHHPVLSTTAPFYALLLSAGALLWPDLPSLANTLSAAAFGAGAILLFLLGRRERAPWVGLLAALLYLLCPLLWLSLGLETATFLALALAAILAYRAGRLYWTAVLLALATLTRNDGLILAAILAADYLLSLVSSSKMLWDRLAEGSLSVFRSSWYPKGHGVPLENTGPGLRNPQPVEVFHPSPYPQSHDDRSRKRPANLSWRPALTALALYVAVMLPVLAWLTWQFGSPLPATLAAKRAQAELGITGFYAHTTYLQGLAILARAWLAQSPFYLLFLPAAAVDLVAMTRRAAWIRLLAAWGAAHLLGYTLLGVTPYSWYYAPLVPALVSVSALGVVESGRFLSRVSSRAPVMPGDRTVSESGQPVTPPGLASVEPPIWTLPEMGRVAVGGVALLWAIALLLSFIQSDWAIFKALAGPVPPPEDPLSKVLPEAKVDVYAQAGRWLSTHTPPDALVGVTEVGIMGYYARRPMVDFLGLLEPDVARALARGDLYWALLQYQPDYLALTAVAPLYAYDLRADPWFQAAYTPVQSFEDPRFWGSPLIVYWRQVPRTPLTEAASGDLPAAATRLDVDFDGKIRLLAALSSDSTLQPGAVASLTLYWQALAPVDQDYTVFVHLLGRYDRVIAQRDTPPGLGVYPTSQWIPGQIVADPYLLALPETAYAPDQAVWEVGLYDAGTGRRLLAGSGDNVRFGNIAIQPAAEPLHLNFGPVALTGYQVDRLALAPGESIQVSLQWAGQGQVQALLQMVDEQGQIRARSQAALDQNTYSLAPAADAPPGAYDLELLVLDAATGQSLPLLGPDGQPRSDRVGLTKVRLYP
jgi:hypothetical protein